MLSGLVEEVLLRAEAHLERHDELLAQGVYGGVGDLREVLLEVREEELRPLGEHRKRRVRAHRAVGLLAVLGHRGEEYALVLDGVAEGPLALQEAGRFGTRVGMGLGELVQVDLPLLQPLAVRLPPEQRLLDVLVV